MKNLKSKLFSIVASILLISVVSGGLYAFADTTTTPTSYVLQPGIELIVNEQGIVTDVETLNTTAETVLGDLDLLDLTVEAAIVKVVQHMQTLGYTYGVDDILVTENEVDVKKAEKLYDKLEKLLQNNKNTKNHGNQANVEEDNEDDDDDDETEINEPGNEDAKGYMMVQAAREIEGLNPGKYNIIMNKMGKNPVNYANKTNQEIMKEYVASK
jgi:hypothetical protein